MFSCVSGSILDADIAVKFDKCRIYESKAELGGQAGLVSINFD